MNQPERTTKPRRSLGLWLTLLALVFASASILSLALFTAYLSRQTANTELKERIRIAEQEATRLQLLQDEYRGQATPATTPLPTVTAAASAVANQVSASTTQVRVDFSDFGSRTADALVIDFSDGLSHLTVPSTLFTAISGKVNGRIITQPPAGITLFEVRLDSPGAAFGMSMPGGAAAATMGGSPIYPPSSPVYIAVSLPGVGLTLLNTQTRLHPLRIKGDFATAQIGDVLSGPPQNNASPMPAPTTLTVLATDESIPDASGQQLVHLLKLTGWPHDANNSHSGQGVILSNSKGDPIAQIVLTLPGQSGGSFTYAATLGQIFDAYYAQNNETETDPRAAIPGDSSFEVEVGAKEPLRELPSLGGIPESAPPIRATTLIVDDNPSTGPAAQAELPPLVDDRKPTDPADALQPLHGLPAPELRIYKVKLPPAEVVVKLRPLLDETAYIAVGSANDVIRVVADSSTHEKVAAALNSMSDDVVRPGKGSEPQTAILNRGAEASPFANNLSSDSESSGRGIRGMSEDAMPRKDTPRSLTIKTTGRDPREVAGLLTKLYGKQTAISLNETTGQIFITVDRTETEAKAQQVLAAIEATAATLTALAPSDPTAVPINGIGTNGLTGQLTIAPGTPPEKPTPIDDRFMDRQARQLAQRYRSADAADQPRLRKELAELTERHFNLRQAERQREIEEISGRVEKLRVSQQKRQQQKTEVIERRLQNLLDFNSDFWLEEKPDANTASAVDQTVSRRGDRPSLDTVGRPGMSRVPADSPDLQPPATTPPTSSEPSAEKTYDGVAYGQWLNTLAAEHKPAKLCAAIDACTRLASPQDQTRIARQIFTSAQSFDSRDDSERMMVWTAAWSGLGRLRPEVVATELVTAIEGPDQTPLKRHFQGQLLVSPAMKAVHEQLLKQSPKLIEDLVKQHQSERDSDWLLAGACSLWANSNRPLNDIVGLQAQMLRMIDDGFSVEQQSDNEIIRAEWKIVANVMVAKCPDTPGLALKFWKHAENSAAVLRLIGELGRHAEPVVPLLVDDFVAEWNRYELEIRTVDSESSPRFRAATPPRRCRDLIATLAKIGVGEKGGLLLRDLSLIRPSGSRVPLQLRGDILMGGLYPRADEAIGNWTLPSNDTMPLILSDITMIDGYWQLKSGLPDPETYVVQFRHSSFGMVRPRNNGRLFGEANQPLGRKFDLNSKAALKQISFYDVELSPGAAGKEAPGTRRDGIYELTGTSLKIQLAENGKPRPTEFVKDSADAATEGILLEFQREIPERTSPAPTESR